MKIDSQRRPSDRLQIAPGYLRSTAAYIAAVWVLTSAIECAFFSRASNTTSFASGTIACATSRSIGVSPPGSPGWSESSVGRNEPSPTARENWSRSVCLNPSISKNTIVLPLPVKPWSASAFAL